MMNRILSDMSAAAVLAVAVIAAAGTASSCSLVDSAKGAAKSGMDAAKNTVDKARTKLRGETRSDSVTVKVMTVTGSASICGTCYAGTAEPVRETTVTTSNPGTLTTLAVKPGAKVVAGTLIARVESQAIRSSYEMACSKLAQAEDGYERLKKLQATGSIAEVRMVEMETNLQQARSAKAAAEKALWHCTVKAPFSGIVETVYAEQGTEVAIAAPIAKIVDVSSVEIHFSVPENEIASIGIGDRAVVEIPALNRTTSAKVASKGVVASALSHSYDCTLSKPADVGNLMPGMSCKVFLEHNGGNGVVVPSTCVMTDLDGRYVWTVSGGVVAKSYVTVGGYSGNGIIVGDGLSDAEYVIIEGARKVSTGMTVKTIE